MYFWNLETQHHNSGSKDCYSSLSYVFEMFDI
jgi:hypothetical protein